MSCIILGPNVKIFGKAIHTLARIGDDLYIEALPTGLMFRTINSSKSAYVCFTYDPNFFAQYIGSSKTKCKVLLKSCLMPFRSLPNLEKTVEKCVVDLLNMEDFLLIQFFCKHEMTKIYHLPFIENETIQAAFQKTGFVCKLIASSRLLYDGVQNFSNSVEEMTLTVCTNKVILKNYVDGEPDPNKVVHTEITLESEEFETFEVEEETELTFCLKELKAILNFSEGCSVPVTIQCQTSGKPITFSIDSLRGVQGDFLLATLADSNTQSTSKSLQKTPVALTPKNNEMEKNKSQFNQGNEGNTSVQVMEIDLISQNSGVRNPSRGSQSVNHNTTQSRDEINNAAAENDVPNLDDMDEDIVPSTPPRKKFRSAFLGLSQATYTSMAPDPDEVLVSDSDED